MAKKYPAVLALSAVVAGIISADLTSIPSWAFLFSILILFPISIIAYFKRNTVSAGIVLMLGLAALSAFGYSFRYRTFPPRHIIHYVDTSQEYRIFGTVDDWPIIREHQTNLYITVDSLSRQGQTIRSIGRILVNVGTETSKFQYGDRIQFESQLYSIKGGKNPSGLDYRRYLNLKNVFASAYLPHQYAILIDPAGHHYYMRLVDRLRSEIIETFKNSLEPQPAALASGFLIGETRDIPIEIYNLFRDSGTLHLLAVSGSNVGLVVIFFIFLLRATPLKRTGKTIFLLAVILVFTLLSYNQPSVVRAAVMASLVLLGKAFQRKIDLNNIIASAALIILLVRPTELFDIGFQLSFITAWGLIFFTPLVVGLLRSIHSRLYYKVLIFPFIISFIAQIVALPMSAYYFQRLPLISFISNLIIVPLVSFIVIGEVILLLAAFILPITGNFIGSLLNPPLLLTISLLEKFGSGEVTAMLWRQLFSTHLFLYYMFLILASLSIYSRKARRLLVVYILLTANIFLLAGSLTEKEDYRFTICACPGGIVAVNRLEKHHILLSDLPLKDYHISEKTALPLLINHGIDNYQIIALSDDYQTIKETSFLLGRSPLATAYLPIKSYNLYRDINSENVAAFDSGRIVFYDDAPLSELPSVREAYLSDQCLIYNFESVIISYFGGKDPQNVPEIADDRGEKTVIFVESYIDDKDISALLPENTGRQQYIICNRLSQTVRDKMAVKDTWLPPNVVIIETSQVGAVELLIRDGRLTKLF